MRINRRTKEFRAFFDALPEVVRLRATEAFQLFLLDPHHPALRLHKLKNSKKGQHLPESWSVSINMQYRAIYVVADATNLWYWVGTHADYNHFTGKN